MSQPGPKEQLQDKDSVTLKTEFTEFDALIDVWAALACLIFRLFPYSTNSAPEKVAYRSMTTVTYPYCMAPKTTRRFRQRLYIKLHQNRCRPLFRMRRRRRLPIFLVPFLLLILLLGSTWLSTSTRNPTSRAAHACYRLLLCRRCQRRRC
jgi:hypothetical protein